jgi:catechol 2,3-dioxygenase-like lactoylglutathione lyase family enzyme
MKKRPPDRQPFMPAPEYGRSLRPGLGVNLIVADVAATVRFATEVLGATTAYADEDFAVLRCVGAEWMAHADHTYRDNPVSGLVAGVTGRGAGVELRLYGCDPDAAEARARPAGYTVLAGAIDKPHGLREAVILDDDGYCWVPGVALAAGKA